MSKVEREVRECKKTNADFVKVPNDNVILAIKINTSMLSIQDIHDRWAKFSTITESWCSKNYAFEFVECITLS
jgi:hypothetical protein